MTTQPDLHGGLHAVHGVHRLFMGLAHPVRALYVAFPAGCRRHFGRHHGRLSHGVRLSFHAITHHVVFISHHGTVCCTHGVTTHAMTRSFGHAFPIGGIMVFGRHASTAVTACAAGTIVFPCGGNAKAFLCVTLHWGGLGCACQQQAGQGGGHHKAVFVVQN